MKHTPMFRIKSVIGFYMKRGVNKESVNQVYRNILKNKLKKVL